MSRINVLDQLAGAGPRMFGVNVEIQDHAERSNLWDFLADSGVNCVRTFHPEQSMRRAPATEGELGAFTSWSDFERFRSAVLQDPEQGPIRWDAYRFSEQIPWMGVPEDFLRKYQDIGIEALVSIGIGPGDFPQSLVPDLMAHQPPQLQNCHPEAAAVLYEYAFAVTYFCAKHHGVRMFMTVNEPEWAPKFFHIAEELKHLKRLPIIRESDHGRSSPEGDAYRRCFGIQFAVMAELIRMALDDVQALLGLEDRLILSGPTSNQFFAVLSNYAAPWLDVLDFHHYSDHAESHQQRIDQAHAVAKAYPGKRLAISEFNLKAGPTPVEKMMFVLPAALAQCDVVMTAIEAGSDETPLDYLALYLFAGPSTHRSFKHLVYGDLNLLSWDGKDSALRSKGPEWYPTFEELQLRHCTPAYHVVKALARAVQSSGKEGCDRLACSLAEEEKLRVLATRCGQTWYITLLDRRYEDAFATQADHQVDAPTPAQAEEPEQGPLLVFPESCVGMWAVVRRTAMGEHDEIRQVTRLTTPDLQLEEAPQSVTQVMLIPHDLDHVNSLRLQEERSVEGSSSLRLYETLRLRAIAGLEGEEIDLSDQAIHWESSAPYSVTVGPTGLVQRLRDTVEPETITATLLPRGLQAQMHIPQSSSR